MGRSDLMRAISDLLKQLVLLPVTMAAFWSLSSTLQCLYQPPMRSHGADAGANRP